MTLQELEEKYQKIYYVEDVSPIALVAAVVIANKLKNDPVWLMLVGGSSSGKSELINAVTGVNFVHEVSTLTSNTLLSGMANKGKETSLLLKIQNGVIVMKDFTTIMSLPSDTRTSVMGQLREVYDGHMIKETGTGKSIKWKGKIGLIGASTEKIYSLEREFNEMGTRWINYVLKSQDRLKTTERALDNGNKIKEMREEIKVGFTEYISTILADLPPELPEIDKDFKKDIMLVSDLCSLARSSVERNFKDEITMVLSPEMPMRMAGQLKTLAQVMTFMSGGEISEDKKRTIFKIGFDSISKSRRMALFILAKYNSVNSAGLATRLDYPTKTVRKWLEELNAHGVCKRIKSSGVGTGDKWVLEKDYKDIVLKYSDTKKVNEDLIGEDDTADGYDQSYYMGMGLDETEKEEMAQQADDIFENGF